MPGTSVCACWRPAIRSRGHAASPIVAPGPLKRSSWCKFPQGMPQSRGGVRVRWSQTARRAE
eukprot:3370656-Prymnesium_polylepis.2